MDTLKIRIEVPVPADANKKNVSKLWIPSKSSDFVMRWSNEISMTEDSWQKEMARRVLLPDRNAVSIDAKTPSIYEDDAQIEFKLKSKIRKSKARVLVTPMDKQKYIAASIRLSGVDKTDEHTVNPPLNRKFAFRILLEAHEDPKGKPKARNLSKYVFGPDAVCEVVLSELGLVEKSDLTTLDLKLGEVQSDPKSEQNLGDAGAVKPPAIDRVPKGINEHPSGVIIISGGTGTGKSTYARGIALRYLIQVATNRIEEQEEKGKLPEFEPPHLVSFEDPIEAWSVTKIPNGPLDAAESGVEVIDLNASPQADLSCGIRLTSRAKSHDVSNLNSACINALRQKPSVVYIGECREAADWNLALELGGTGHLVITTCHASSLVDTFVKLAGTGNRDAQSRQALASSILGMLHLKNSSFQMKKSCFKDQQTFFSLWKKTPESVSNFVVDGLASIVVDEENIISHKGMAERILKLQADDTGEFTDKTWSKIEFFQELKACASKYAFDLDLAGI